MLLALHVKDALKKPKLYTAPDKYWHELGVYSRS